MTPLIIQAPHQRISKTLKRTIERKVQRITKIFDRIEKIELTVNRAENQEPEKFSIKARVVLPGNDLFVQAKGESFLTTIDMVCSSLESQIKKQKDKLQRKRVKPVDEFIGEV